MLKKYCGSVVPEHTEDVQEIDTDLVKTIHESVSETRKFIENNLDPSKALGSIFEIFSKANKYIEVTEPYRLAKDETQKERLGNVLRNLLESIRVGTILLSAFLPDCSQKVLDAFGIENPMFEDTKEIYKLSSGSVVGELGILFPRIDADKEFEELAKIQEENNN